MSQIKAPSKTATTRSKSPVATTVTHAVAIRANGAAHDSHPLDGEQRTHMIAEAAYYRALQRGFTGGSPQEDWLAAEREIDESLMAATH